MWTGPRRHTSLSHSFVTYNRRSALLDRRMQSARVWCCEEEFTHSYCGLLRPTQRRHTQSSLTACRTHISPPGIRYGQRHGEYLSAIASISSENCEGEVTDNLSPPIRPYCSSVKKTFATGEYNVIVYLAFRGDVTVSLALCLMA